MTLRSEGMPKELREALRKAKGRDYFEDDPHEQINGDNERFDASDFDPPPVKDPSEFGFDGSEQAGATPKGSARSRLLQSSWEFVASYVPLDYLVDGLILEAFLYSLTGATGAGKTTIALRLAASVALGIAFAKRETKKRRVIYLAAENPEDIRMRWIALAQQMDFDANAIEVYFVEGVFKISQLAGRLKAEAAELGGEFGLVVVDTSPVFYEGDDENNRKQQGQHAEMLRSLGSISIRKLPRLSFAMRKHSTPTATIPIFRRSTSKSGGNTSHVVLKPTCGFGSATCPPTRRMRLREKGAKRAWKDGNKLRRYVRRGSPGSRSLSGRSKTARKTATRP